MDLTALDLFCGAGGLSSGLVAAGFRVVGALDSWDVAVRTYQRNFSHPVLLDDIRAVRVSDFLSRIGWAGSGVKST